MSDKVNFCKDEYELLVKKFRKASMNVQERISKLDIGWHVIPYPVSMVLANSNSLFINDDYRIWLYVICGEKGAGIYPYALQVGITPRITRKGRRIGKIESIVHKEAYHYSVALDGDKSMSSYIEVIAFDAALHSIMGSLFSYDIVNKEPEGIDWEFLTKPFDWEAVVFRPKYGNRVFVQFYKFNAVFHYEISRKVYLFHRPSTVWNIRAPYFFEVSDIMIADGGRGEMISF